MVKEVFVHVTQLYEFLSSHQHLPLCGKENSPDDTLMLLFIFSLLIGFDVSCKLSHYQISKPVFHRKKKNKKIKKKKKKNKKKYFKMSSAEFLFSATIFKMSSA